MKKIYQTHFGSPNGNCMQACVASILDLTLEEVPNFIKSENPLKAVNLFFNNYGMDLLWTDYDKNRKPEGYYILDCRSSRDLPHWVIGRRGKVVHDPHPKGGIAEFYSIIYVVNLMLSPEEYESEYGIEYDGY